MSLEYYHLNSGVHLQLPAAGNPDLSSCRWVIQPYLERSALRPSTWVRLLETSSLINDDQALLLCEEWEDYWLAWIPDYGETLVHISQIQAIGL